MGRLNRKLSEILSCKGTDIELKESAKYLGATLEQCFSGENTVKSISQNANARLKFLYRKQKYLNMHTKKHGWIRSVCVCVGGGGGQGVRTPPEKSQKYRLS